MGRRKKEQVEEEITEDEYGGGLSEETKRSIVAIMSVFFAIVFVLGFFGIAGLVGKYLDFFAKSVFGWGKWLFPIVLLLSSAVLLRKTIRFYIMSIIGLGVAYIALLGFLHIFFEASMYREIIFLGKGGGYVGYGLSVGLTILFGKIGAVVTLSVLMIIGVLVAFNSSLLPIYEHMRSVHKKISKQHVLKKEKLSLEKESSTSLKKEKDEMMEEEEEVQKEREIISEEVVPAEKEKETKKSPTLTNISAIHFQGATLIPEEGEDDEKEEEREEEEEDLEIQQEEESDIEGEPNGEKEWHLPSLDLLEKRGGNGKSGATDQNKEVIQETLRQFGIDVSEGGENLGPTVTQYMFRPAPGVKLERITALGNNLAMALSAQSIRIEAPIPGKALVGIEVPNHTRGTVRLREVLEDEEYQSKLKESRLLVPLGKNVSGGIEMGDLEKMPHLLIAGTTGSGKSVCINTILTALLYQNNPEELQFILVDPKRVELSLYSGIPHLKADVIVENKKVLGALRWAVGEMERRYQILQQNESRNIKAYNERVIQRRKRGVSEPTYMPFIVIVIDELADLMGTHGKEVEGAIARLAQMSRAVGIHLIIATQRPDVHVLTGLIKTNISTRIAFKVPTQIDSRTILDKGGAEKLLGLGDMLYIHSANPAPTRIQGVFLSTKEAKKVIRFWKESDEKNRSNDDDSDDDEEAEAEANKPALEMGDIAEKVGSFHEKLDMDTLGQEESVHDSLFDEARELVERVGKASTSLIQRHLRIGYNRAARIIDELEADGIVGPADGAKPREVFSSAEEKDQE